MDDLFTVSIGAKAIHFTWDAFSAIGTVGAVWFAVIQSTRAQRMEHLKAVGTLTALIGLVEPVTQAFPIFEPEEGDLLTLEESAELMESRFLIERAVEGLKSFPISDLAAVDATEYVVALPLALMQLKEAVTPRSHQPFIASEINQSARYIAEASDFFRLHRQYLKYGALIRRFARLPLPDRLSPELVRQARRLFPKRW